MRIVMALLLILSFSLAVNAEDIKIPNEDGQAGDRVDCDVTGCDYFSMTVGQLLTTDILYTFGPLATTGGDPITNVVLELDIAQTWVGDLVAFLYYDADGDGVVDAGPVAALCRPNLVGCEFPDGCCGCSGNIAGLYTFGDDAVESLGDPNCPTDIPNGCYLPAPETAAGFAATFGGFPSGGDWYLEIGDAAAGDDTTLNGFGVYVCTSPTGTEETSWGQIKGMYR